MSLLVQMNMANFSSKMKNQVLLESYSLISVKLAIFIFLDSNSFFGTLATLAAFECIIIYKNVFYKYKNESLKYSISALLIVPLIYTLVPAMLMWLDIGEVFPFSEVAIRSGFLLQSLSSTFLWVFFYIFISASLINKTTVNVVKYYAGAKHNSLGKYIFAFIGLLLLAVYISIFIYSGVANLIGVKSRAEIVGAFEVGKVWIIQYIFACWVMVLLSQYASHTGFFGKSKWFSIFCIGIIIGFIYFYIQIGNRRELVIIAIFSLAIFSIFHKQKYIFKIFYVLFPGLIYYGLSRSGEADAIVDRSEIDILLNLIGEFVYPNFPLINSIESHSSKLFGASYLATPFTFIPSFDLWDRPKSLALDFAASYAQGVMGFAYTPMGEAYINFGYFGVVIYPILLVMTIKLILIYSNKFPVFVLIPFAFAMDVARGEFSSIFVQASIFACFIFLLLRTLQVGRSKLGISVVVSHNSDN